MGKQMFSDLLRAVVLGILLALACFAAAFLCGLALRHNAASGLEAAKNALCLLAALMLFLLSGALLSRGKNPAAFDAESNGWRRRFRVLGPKAVLFCMAVCFIAFAALADALLRAAG